MTEYDESLDTVDLSDAPDSAPTIPADNYHMRIVDAEMRNTKEGGGKYINYRAIVQSGPYTGEAVWGMWTTRNSAGKKDNVWRTKGDLKRLGVTDFSNISAATVLGLEGIAKVTEKNKKRDGEVLSEKENNIASWVGSV